MHACTGFQQGITPSEKDPCPTLKTMTTTSQYTLTVSPREERDNVRLGTTLSSNHPGFNAGDQVQAEGVTLVPRGEADVLPVMLTNLSTNTTYTATLHFGEGDLQEYRIAGDEG